MKLEPRSPAKPSRVVHIRNIPNDVTEAEIVHLGIPLGRVTNVLVLKGKNQVRFLFYLILCPLRKPYFPSRSFAVWPDRAALVACWVGGLPFLILLTSYLFQAFLEMADEGAAISMVNYFSNGTSAQLRGRNVFVQYSNHTQLKTDQSHSNAVRLVFLLLF